MSNALGLIGFVAYIVAIVGLAAAVTWVVVRFTPSRKQDGSAES